MSFWATYVEYLPRSYRRIGARREYGSLSFDKLLLHWRASAASKSLLLMDARHPFRLSSGCHWVSLVSNELRYCRRMEIQDMNVLHADL